MIMAWTSACPAAKIAPATITAALCAGNEMSAFISDVSMKDFAMHDSTIGFSPAPTTTTAQGIASKSAPMSDPNVTYHDIFAANYTVTGIRQDGGTERPVIITGSYESSPGAAPQALLYRLTVRATHFLKPSFQGRNVTSSVLCGPNTLFDPGIGAGNVRAVGSYKFAEGSKLDHGMMYEGPWDGLGTRISWSTAPLPGPLPTAPWVIGSSAITTLPASRDPVTA